MATGNPWGARGFGQAERRAAGRLRGARCQQEQKPQGHVPSRSPASDSKSFSLGGTAGKQFNHGAPLRAYKTSFVSGQNHRNNEARHWGHRCCWVLPAAGREGFGASLSSQVENTQNFPDWAHDTHLATETCFNRAGPPHSQAIPHRKDWKAVWVRQGQAKTERCPGGLQGKRPQCGCPPCTIQLGETCWACTKYPHMIAFWFLSLP